MAPTEYGPELECTHVIDKPGVMDVVVSDGHLFFVGSGRLYVADISNPASPTVVGSCAFDGNGRQLAVEDGTAYVTARGNGVFIFDVRRPKMPEMICHYDCIELATGVEVHGDLLFIAQRQYGVEIVDIRDPSNPAYVSKIKTDEAQSADARDSYLYVGDWGVCKLTTIDISDPYHPRIIASHDLDGYGDGVCVAGEFLYASTGHHSMHIGAFQKPGDPGFGKGHGMEVFSLSDPAEPRFLGRTKFRESYVRDVYDMWTPVAAGDFVCCADAFNGVYVVDVTDPADPRIVAHYPGLVAGVAVVDGIIYAARVSEGLHVLAAPELVRRRPRRRGTPVKLPPARPEIPEGCRAYRPGGQVWSVEYCGEYALVAAGMAGLRVVEVWPEFREVFHVQTEGFAVHACAVGDRVYVSENTGGFSIWEHVGGGQLRPLGRYDAPGGQAIRQGMVYAGGTRAVLQSGNKFLVLDVTDPASPRRIAECQMKIIYGNQMSRGDVEDRYACVWGHIDGVRWLDFGKPAGEIDTGVDLTDGYSFFAGIAAVGDQFLCTCPGGYRLVSPLETDLNAKPVHRFAQHFLGKPSVYGQGLFLASRVQSAIAIVDITDLDYPRLLRHLPTGGNPGTLVVRDQSLLIPDGRNGLLVYDDFVDAFGLDVDAEAFLMP